MGLGFADRWSDTGGGAYYSGTKFPSLRLVRARETACSLRCLFAGSPSEEIPYHQALMHRTGHPLSGMYADGV
jgi:hypothetical protein